MATPRSGAWTRPPSPRWPRTRRATACRPTSGSGSTSRISSPSPGGAIRQRSVSKNFGALLDAQLQRHSTKPALVWDGGAITFDELRRRVDDFAGALAAKGVGASDRIALTIGNHWAFAVALLAGWKLGATVAPLDVLLKDEERADIVADLEPSLLIDEAHVGGPRPGWPGLGDPTAPSEGSAALILYTSG